MALNRTPMGDVRDDDTFWVGTPDEIAERMIACRRHRLLDVPGGDPRAVRPRDARAVGRRGQADGGARLSGEGANSHIGQAGRILGRPMMKFLNKLVDSNDREVRKLEPFVERTNALEPETTALTDAELAGKTDELRARLRDELGDLLVPIELREAARGGLGADRATNPALLAERAQGAAQARARARSTPPSTPTSRRPSPRCARRCGARSASAITTSS